MNVYNNS